MDYTQYWEPFLEKELRFYDQINNRYLKKGYLHFDPRIWFPDRKDDLKNYIGNPEKISQHPFYPFLQITISTKRIRYDKTKHKRVKQTKEREICYASHIDSLIYSFYSTILTSLYEEYAKISNINSCSLAYRSLDKSNIEFAYEIFTGIKEFENEYGDTAVIALDVKSFFDSLDHDQLWAAWCQILRVAEPEISVLPKDQIKIYKSLTSYSVVRTEDLLNALGLDKTNIKGRFKRQLCSPEEFRNVVRKSGIIKRNTTKKGIPQGSPISAVLSNIYMINFDEHLADLKNLYPLIYRRYCDDIILVCRVSDLDFLKGTVHGLLEQSGLEVQQEKEDIVLIKKDCKSLKAFSPDGKLKKLQYLGFEFDGTTIFIRSSSLSRYHRKVKAFTRETVKRAYGKKSKGRKIFRKKLYQKYTHLGDKNFISYALRASKKTGSNSIRKQISKHMDSIKSTLADKKQKHEKRLSYLGKPFKRMN